MVLYTDMGRTEEEAGLGRSIKGSVSTLKFEIPSRYLSRDANQAAVMCGEKLALKT